MQNQKKKRIITLVHLYEINIRFFQQQCNSVVRELPYIGGVNLTITIIFTPAIMLSICLSSAHFISTCVRETKRGRVMCELPLPTSLLDEKEQHGALDFRVICLTRKLARDYKGKQKSRKGICCRRGTQRNTEREKKFRAN